MPGTVREYLSKTDDQIIRKATIEIITKRLIGRRVMPVWNIGEAAQDAGYDKVTTDMVAAEIIAKGANFPNATIVEGRTTIPIPKIGEGFDIPREDLLTSKALGNPLNTRLATAAGRKIAEKEDGLLINGDTAWNISGLLTAPGNTKAATDVWSAPATAKPFDDVNAAIGLLEEDGFEGRAVILHPTNFSEARGLYITNTGQTHLEKIAGLLPGGMAAILKSDTIAEGTGLVVDTSEDVSQLVVAESLNFENTYEMKRQVYQYNVWERIVPIIYQLNGQCKITGV